MGYLHPPAAATPFGGTSCSVAEGMRENPNLIGFESSDDFHSSLTAVVVTKPNHKVSIRPLV